MTRRRLQLALVVGVVAVFAAVGVATAGRDDVDVDEQLSSYEEVPTLSSPGSGEFDARLNRSGDSMRWELSYRNTDTPVTQAHIHFQGRALNGPIIVFLCTNLGNGPPGTQLCPPGPAEISGTIEAADVLPAAAAAGLEGGNFDEFVHAVRGHGTYANVHTTGRPGGEIRAQLEPGENDDDD